LTGWRLTLYPDAREAAGCYRGIADLTERHWSLPGEGQDPMRSSKVATSRARTAIRRYCTSNRTNRLGTLTYAGAGNFDPMLLRAHLAEFFRNLRESLGGTAFAYLWVPEWHNAHGLHAHFAVGRYVKRHLIEEAWGRGFVKIKLLGDLPAGATSLDEARRAAGYVGKYVGKDVDHLRLMGLHRYDCAEGFQPRKISIPGPSLGDAFTRVCEEMGGLPASYSTSDEWRDWCGPYAVAMSWAS
jgi:hypothetical protein